MQTANLKQTTTTIYYTTTIIIFTSSYFIFTLCTLYTTSTIDASTFYTHYFTLANRSFVLYALDFTFSIIGFTFSVLLFTSTPYPMLSYNMQSVFKARGIEKPFNFLVKAGISPSVAHKIIDSKTRVLRLDHIELICEHLHCTPNDLLQWSAEKKRSIAATHPLTALKPKANIDNWQETIRTLPLDKLAEISRLLKESDKE